MMNVNLHCESGRTAFFRWYQTSRGGSLESTREQVSCALFAHRWCI